MNNQIVDLNPIRPMAVLVATRLSTGRSVNQRAQPDFYRASSERHRSAGLLSRAAASRRNNLRPQNGKAPRSVNPAIRRNNPEDQEQHMRCRNLTPCTIQQRRHWAALTCTTAQIPTTQKYRVPTLSGKRTDGFAWRQGTQRSPLVQFTIGRGPRLLVQHTALNLLQPTGYVMHHQFNP